MFLLLPKANPFTSVSDLISPPTLPPHLLRDGVINCHSSLDIYPLALSPSFPISSQHTHSSSFLEKRYKSKNPPSSSPPLSPAVLPHPCLSHTSGEGHRDMPFPCPYFPVIFPSCLSPSLQVLPRSPLA